MLPERKNLISKNNKPRKVFEVLGEILHKWCADLLVDSVFTDEAVLSLDCLSYKTDEVVPVFTILKTDGIWINTRLNLSYCFPYALACSMQKCGILYYGLIYDKYLHENYLNEFDRISEFVPRALLRDIGYRNLYTPRVLLPSSSVTKNNWLLERYTKVLSMVVEDALQFQSPSISNEISKYSANMVEDILEWQFASKKNIKNVDKVFLKETYYPIQCEIDSNKITIPQLKVKKSESFNNFLNTTRGLDFEMKQTASECINIWTNELIKTSVSFVGTPLLRVLKHHSSDYACCVFPQYEKVNKDLIPIRIPMLEVHILLFSEAYILAKMGILSCGIVSATKYDYFRNAFHEIQDLVPWNLLEKIGYVTFDDFAIRYKHTKLHTRSPRRQSPRRQDEEMIENFCQVSTILINNFSKLDNESSQLISKYTTSIQDIYDWIAPSSRFHNSVYH